MESKSEGRRRVERPKNRWINWELQDAKYLKISRWWMLARNRDVWRGIMRELSCCVNHDDYDDGELAWKYCGYPHIPKL